MHSEFTFHITLSPASKIPKKKGAVRLEAVRALRAGLMAPTQSLPPALALSLRVLQLAAQVRCVGVGVVMGVAVGVGVGVGVCAYVRVCVCI